MKPTTTTRPVATSKMSKSNRHLGMRYQLVTAVGAIFLLCLDVKELGGLIRQYGPVDENNTADTVDRRLDRFNETFETITNTTKMTSNTFEINTTVESIAAGPKRDGFCGFIPRGVSASTLWSENAHRVAQVTGSGLFQKKQPDWVLDLVNFLSPRFLRLGYKAPPLPETLDAVLDIIHKRIVDPSTNPPLKVAIFGGSVTQGRGSCRDDFDTESIEENAPSKSDYKCNWVNRMQVYADEFLGPGVVKVFNLASGGTNSGLALPIMQFRLYGDGSELLPEGPDVIINSYTTNDAFVPSHETDVTNETEWTEKKRTLHQDIITRATNSRPCSKLPLVAYMSDYIGNQHDRIIGEQSNGRAIEELSNWYHTAYVSYADAVKRLVYANSKEHVFSAIWEYRGKLATDAHFGMQGHFSVSWVAAFGALQAVVNHCNDEYTTVESPFLSQHSEDVMNLVERVPPPELGRETRLSTVTQQWNDQKERMAQAQLEVCDGKEPAESCSLAFVAGPVGTVRNGQQMKTYLKARTLNNDGWDIKTDISQGGWSNKLGWVASKANAKATLFVDNLLTPVKFVRIFYLKSYGEDWLGSTLKGSVRSIDANQTSHVVDEFALEGFWKDPETKFSLSIPLVLELKEPVPAGNRLELQLDVTGGTKFKITSIMLCRD